MALRAVASETRLHIAEEQAAGTLPGVGAHDEAEVERLHEEHRRRMHPLQNFQLGGPKKLIGADDPRHAPQENGVPADFWYLDDGDILCHPTLVPPCLQAFTQPPLKMVQDETNKRQKSVRTLATIDTAVRGNITLRVAVGRNSGCEQDPSHLQSAWSHDSQ